MKAPLHRVHTHAHLGESIDHQRANAAKHLPGNKFKRNAVQWSAQSRLYRSCSLCKPMSISIKHKRWWSKNGKLICTHTLAGRQPWYWRARGQKTRDKPLRIIMAHWLVIIRRGGGCTLSYRQATPAMCAPICIELASEIKSNTPSYRTRGNVYWFKHSLHCSVW